MSLIARAEAVEAKRRAVSQELYGRPGASIPGLHFDWKQEALAIERQLQESNMTELRYKTIIGRERALIDGLSKALNNAIGGPAPSKATLTQLRRHNPGYMSETALGNRFEVQIVGPDGQPTGHIVRVTIELERFETYLDGKIVEKARTGEGTE